MKSSADAMKAVQMLLNINYDEHSLMLLIKVPLLAPAVIYGYISFLSNRIVG